MGWVDSSWPGVAITLNNTSTEATKAMPTPPMVSTADSPRCPAGPVTATMRRKAARGAEKIRQARTSMLI